MACTVRQRMGDRNPRTTRFRFGGWMYLASTWWDRPQTHSHTPRIRSRRSASACTGPASGNAHPREAREGNSGWASFNTAVCVEKGASYRGGGKHGGLNDALRSIDRREAVTQERGTTSRCTFGERGYFLRGLGPCIGIALDGDVSGCKPVPRNPTSR